MKRRKFLKVLGGGTVLAASGVTAFALTRTPAIALAPWEAAGRYADPRMNALSHAILAPSSHNLQPWLVEMVGDDGVTLYYNPEKSLPETDPFDRQLCISLGCFLELLTMAAQADGHAVKVDLFPEGEDSEDLGTRPVAHVRFMPESSLRPEPLFAHVLARRSNKEPYDTMRPVPQADLNRLTSAGVRGNKMGGTVDPARVAVLRQMTYDAFLIELETPATYLESVDVFRIGKREVNATPDGLEFHGARFDLLKAAGLFTREAASDMTSTAYRQGVAAAAGPALSAMGFLWIVTETNTRVDQIATGRDWLRVNLMATSLGIGFHPMSQILQEYPEMAPLYGRVHDLLAPQGGTVQMLTRIGYGPETGPTPRWPVEAKVI